MRFTSSCENSEKSVLLPRTSHDFRCGSKAAPDNPRNPPSFFPPEKDFVRRSSGRKELELGRPRNADPPSLLLGLKRDFSAEDADLRPDEAVAEEDLSKTAKRSQRQDGQNPVNCSSGCRSQLVDFKWGCGGCGGGGNCSAVTGFMPKLNFPSPKLPSRLYYYCCIF